MKWKLTQTRNITILPSWCIYLVLNIHVKRSHFTLHNGTTSKSWLRRRRRKKKKEKKRYATRGIVKSVGFNKTVIFNCLTLATTNHGRCHCRSLSAFSPVVAASLPVTEPMQRKKWNIMKCGCLAQKMSVVHLPTGMCKCFVCVHVFVYMRVCVCKVSSDHKCLRFGWIVISLLSFGRRWAHKLFTAMLSSNPQ